MSFSVTDLNALAGTVSALLGSTNAKSQSKSAGVSSLLDIAGTAASIFFPAAGPIIGFVKMFAGDLLAQGKITQSKHDELLASVAEMEKAIAKMTAEAQKGKDAIAKMSDKQVGAYGTVMGWFK